MNISSTVSDQNTQKLGSVSDRNPSLGGRGETLNSSFAVTELLTGPTPDFNWSNTQMPIATLMQIEKNQMNGDREFTDSNSKVTATLNMTKDQVFSLKNNLNTESSGTIGGASALNLTSNEPSLVNSHHIELASTSFQTGSNSSHFGKHEQESTTGDALLIFRASQASLGTTGLDDRTLSFDGFRSGQNESDVQDLTNISMMPPDSDSSRLSNVSIPNNDFGVGHVLKNTDREDFSIGNTRPVTGESNATDLAPGNPIEIVRASQTVAISNPVTDGIQKEVTIRISKMVPEMGINQTISNNLKMTQEVPIMDQAQNAVHISNINASKSQHVSRTGFNNVSSSLDNNIARNDERVNKLTSGMSHIIAGSTNAQSEQTKSGVSVGEINAFTGGSVEMKQSDIESQKQLEQVNTKRFSLETSQLSGTLANVAISNYLDENGGRTFHQNQYRPTDNNKSVPMSRISGVVSNTDVPEISSSVGTKLNDTQSPSVQMTTESFSLVGDGVKNTASTSRSNSHFVQFNTNTTSNLENLSRRSSNQALPIQPHSLAESISSNINDISNFNRTASVNKILVAMSNGLEHNIGTNTTNSTISDMNETRGNGSNLVSFVAGKSFVKTFQGKAIVRNAINLTLGSILTVPSTNRSQWHRIDAKKQDQASVQQIDRETMSVTTDKNSTSFSGKNLSESFKMADTNGSLTVEEKSNMQEKTPSLSNLNNLNSNQTANVNVDMRENKELKLYKLATRTRNLQKKIPDSHLSANDIVQLSKHNTIPSFNQRKNISVLIKHDMDVPFPSSLIKHTTSKILEKQATQSNGTRSPSMKVNSKDVNQISLNTISKGLIGGNKNSSSDNVAGKEWKLNENLRNSFVNGGKTEGPFQGSKAIATSAMNVRLNPRTGKSNLRPTRNRSTIFNSSSRTIISSRNASLRTNFQFQRVIDTRNRTTQRDDGGIKWHSMRSWRPSQSRNINSHNEGVTGNGQDSSRRPTPPNSRRNPLFGNVGSLQSDFIMNQNALTTDFISRLNKDKSQTEGTKVNKLPSGSNQGSESRNNELRLHPDNSNFQQISNRDHSSGTSNSRTDSNPNKSTLRPIPSSDVRLLFLGARSNSRQLFPWNNRRRLNRNSRRRMRRAVTLKPVINSDLAYQIPTSGALKNNAVSQTVLLKFQNDLVSMNQIKTAGELVSQHLFRNNLSVTPQPKTSHLVAMDDSVQTDQSPPRSNLEKDYLQQPVLNTLRVFNHLEIASNYFVDAVPPSKRNRSVLQRHIFNGVSNRVPKMDAMTRNSRTVMGWTNQEN